ncbi:hypothetical protein P3T76_001526 [Phytophthora citrophthora]|uniref:RxLR effector protein n=1 Tax=Phytophthora citrophthora TaxID=4793 RepID=A0AAD9GZJ4_9STRA|nr:hypothetical protein P3T76_001526 [Phytophthora citrophthora]
MQFSYITVIAVAILVTWVDATRPTSGYEQPTNAFTERGRLLGNEDTVNSGKRFLRIHHAKENKIGDNEEERGALDTLRTRANLELWFLKKKMPEYVRHKLQVPPSGGAMFRHANYKYYIEYMERYNKYYRIMKYNS